MSEIDFHLNARQLGIVTKTTFGVLYSVSELSALTGETPSDATLRRDLRDLEQVGLLDRVGDTRATRYQKTIFGALNAPIDPHAYFRLDPDTRHGLSRYVHDLWLDFPPRLLSQEQITSLDQATAQYIERSAAASPLIRAKELERFVIELSWKSSRIEGNTYTLLDTERLLRDGIEAPGHTRDEATMILNHKRAFQFVLEHGTGARVSTPHFIHSVHQLLTQDLGVATGHRHGAVGITGSTYRPLEIPAQINDAIHQLCRVATTMHDPYSAALLMLVGISYIQPFEDGNKRTARLMANAILIAHGKAPLSYRSVDEIAYRESMLTFYEQLSIAPMRTIFIDQYRFACAQYLKS